MSVAAVVVTRGRPGYLDACVSAIRSQTAPATLVLVDNGAGPEVAGLLRDGDVHVRFEDNRGCSAGFAAGIERATALGCDLAWLLDDDCRPEPTALSALLAAAARRPDAAAYEGRVLNYRERRPRAPARLRRGPVAVLLRGPIARDDGDGPTLACFGNLLVRLEILARVGPPHRDAWVYADDWELSLRLERAGAAIVRVDDSVCAHRYREAAPGSWASLHDAPRARAARYYYYRNLLWMVGRHHPRLRAATALHLAARAALVGALGAARSPRAGLAHLRVTGRGILDGWAGRLGPRELDA